MHQRHEQVQLRLFPEVLPLVGVGGVFDDDLRDGLHQVLVLLNLAEAVPGVAVGHVQQIEHPHLIALFFQKSGHTLVNFSLWIDQDHALLPAGGLEDKGLHKAPGLAGAGGAVDHGVLGEAAPRLQGDIFGVFVVILRAVLPLAQQGAVQVLDGPG